mmetsp:Transcript_49159/g.136295  ORF Transcript_49159/g.136295 Transcript_49159/m.136295 type:complete len:271 (+) Transcript_49159:787-1599(+)
MGGALRRALVAVRRLLAAVLAPPRPVLAPPRPWRAQLRRPAEGHRAVGTGRRVRAGRALCRLPVRAVPACRLAACARRRAVVSKARRGVARCQLGRGRGLRRGRAAVAQAAAAYPLCRLVVRPVPLVEPHRVRRVCRRVAFPAAALRMLSHPCGLGVLPHQPLVAPAQRARERHVVDDERAVRRRLHHVLLHEAGELRVLELRRRRVEVEQVDVDHLVKVEVAAPPAVGGEERVEQSRIAHFYALGDQEVTARGRVRHGETLSSGWRPSC